MLMDKSTHRALMMVNYDNKLSTAFENLTNIYISDGCAFFKFSSSPNTVLFWSVYFT